MFIERGKIKFIKWNDKKKCVKKHTYHGHVFDAIARTTVVCICVHVYYVKSSSVTQNEIRTFSMRFNENVKKGTHAHTHTNHHWNEKTRPMNERTDARERARARKLEQMGHISLKFMRFKLMRINQNGIRFNFYLNCFAVHSFCVVDDEMLCYYYCWRCRCFCIFNEFIFGVGSFGTPKCLNTQRESENERLFAKRNYCKNERKKNSRDRLIWYRILVTTAWFSIYHIAVELSSPPPSSSSHKMKTHPRESKEGVWWAKKKNEWKRE